MRSRRGLGCGCFGCGGSSLLVLAVLGALAWFFVIQPARSFLESWRPPAQTQTQSQPPAQGQPQTGTNGGTVIQPPNLPQGGKTTPPAPTDPAPAPAGNADRPVTATAAVTAADVQRFVRVRRDVRQALGGSFTSLQQVWTDIQNGQAPNILTVMRVLGDAGSSIGRARQAQATALNRERLSTERYAVIRSTVNRALGVPNIDFARAAETLQQGRLPDLNTTVQAATPGERALVAPHRAELTQTAALGLLGL